MGMLQALMNMRNVEDDELQKAMAESLREHEERVEKDKKEAETKQKVEAEQEDIKKYYSSLSESKEIPKETGKVTDDFDEYDEFDQPDEDEEEDFIDEEEEVEEDDS